MSPVPFHTNFKIYKDVKDKYLIIKYLYSSSNHDNITKITMQRCAMCYFNLFEMSPFFHEFTNIHEFFHTFYGGLTILLSILLGHYDSLPRYIIQIGLGTCP